MARVLCYTSPARGHLFPTVPVLLELQARGHAVRVITLADEVEALGDAGLDARAMDPAIEALVMEDHLGRTPMEALDRGVRTFVARAAHEVGDLRRALAEHEAELLLVDFNCWGASAAAEASGLPWALFMPYFLPWRLPGLPPFGAGLAPRRDLVGRVRDAIAGALVRGLVNRNLPRLNAVRGSVGLPPLRDMSDSGRQAPLLLYYTAEPFEYPCPERPESVVPIGPGRWEPPGEVPVWLDELDHPVVLVTCSTEFQDDGRLVEVALEALAGEELSVVATTAGVEAEGFSAPDNARVVRFLPHGPLLARAACVVCHGGMGITQKALAAGVPVVVVPFGRDQLDVARHVEAAGAGVRLPPGRLRPDRLREAVHAARACTEGASRVAAAFAAAGGPARGADALEALISRSPLAAPVAVSG